ncbi:MAG: hypothetical protein QXQ53_06960 [Candidatus Methanosuratincola sp.]
MSCGIYEYMSTIDWPNRYDDDLLLDCGPFNPASFKVLSSLGRNDQPQQEIGQDAGYPARDQGDQKRQTEPKRADPEEFAQAAAHAGEHTIAP